jgi:hypothetical protein
MSPWPFADPENVAAISLRDIVDGKAPILLVAHDEEDGMWQFLDGRDNPDPADGVVVCLKHVFGLDPSVGELADLPYGWRAWRDAPDQPWQREEMGSEGNE